MNEIFSNIQAYCPKCNAKITIDTNSMSCPKCEYNLKNKEGIYVSDSQYEEYYAFQQFNGTQLRERVNAEFSTSKYEYIIYKSFIENVLDLINSNKIILEIGAGDGRFTGILLKNNYVIANDVNFQSLQRYKNTISVLEKEKILFICASFDDMPIFLNEIELMIAIESLLYANENFQDILQTLMKNIKPNGYIIDSEPIKSSAILYSLLNNEAQDNIVSLLNGKKKENLIDDMIINSRVFTKAEIENIYLSSKLMIKKQSGTPELISIISLLLSKNKLELSIAKKILDKYLYEYTDNYRCLISLLQVEDSVE